MDTHLKCLCGSGADYHQCCGLYHTGKQHPTTAEALIRSRFTAYALDDTAYILATWDAQVPPEKIDFSAEKLNWQRLEIIDTKKGGAKDTKGVVEFKAYYAKHDEEHVLHEISRFVKKNGRWFYLSGVVKAVGKIIQQTNQGKNAPCPCGSGKKFKRCCGAE